MILIADSGSTKCDWIIHQDDGVNLESQTMGFNPFFHSSEFIQEKLLRNSLLQSNKDNITTIYYYGAGCSSPESNAIVKIALQSTFPKATKINVAEDMLGAALATSKGKKGIVCILGTGSNSCYFDGNRIHSEVQALGYILGDEGSGANIGKQLLRDYLYGSMPVEIEGVMDNIGISKNKLLAKVYKEPHANAFLASLVKELSNVKNHPYITNIIKTSFTEFAKIHITCFENYQNIPVHFVGSIAFYNQTILEEVAKDFQFEIGMVIRQPIQYIDVKN